MRDISQDFRAQFEDEVRVKAAEITLRVAARLVDGKLKGRV
jgi:hypothetical protein